MKKTVPGIVYCSLCKTTPIAIGVEEIEDTENNDDVTVIERTSTSSRCTNCKNKEKQS
jgi:hypothetical protein